jgi:hypothetical protein
MILLRNILFEAKSQNQKDLQIKKITLSVDLGSMITDKQSKNRDWLKDIKQDIYLVFGKNSTSLFNLSPDIPKYSGLSIKDAEVYNETPTDAYVYGLVNVMNGGKDIFMFHNGMRLTGAVKSEGLWPAIFEQLSHETLHLTRLVLTKHIAKLKGASANDWIKYDFGSGKYIWPAMGEIDKNNPIVLIDEESFATIHGIFCAQLVNTFLEMASMYVDELKKKN